MLVVISALCIVLAATGSIARCYSAYKRKHYTLISFVASVPLHHHCPTFKVFAQRQLQAQASVASVTLNITKFPRKERRANHHGSPR